MVQVLPTAQSAELFCDSRLRSVDSLDLLGFQGQDNSDWLMTTWIAATMIQADRGGIHSSTQLATPDAEAEVSVMSVPKEFPHVFGCTCRIPFS